MTERLHDLHSDRADRADEVLAGGRGTVIVSSMASDSHTWNLVYLELLVGELGFDVVNLGACAPDELLEYECLSRRPVMLVLSSVNGHGYQDGLRVIQRLRGCRPLRRMPVVLGGKLGTGGALTQEQTGQLLLAGFDAVFDDQQGSGSFRRFAAALPSPAGVLPMPAEGAGA
ncbi:cobalamin B12-binding domain-containing protein [Actinokineospora enzanensis]|uniref:cobalamin B12-binding domain-containing protein n=1 Tax=Actinokineospora enzanensis TaxID=155975 RepID=UPI00035E4138|nr:cobalamin B12-binding domain-containing protein [Actinokineospora enzanensis]